MTTKSCKHSTITIGQVKVPCILATVKSSQLLEDDRYQFRYDPDLEKRALDITKSVCETNSTVFREPIIVRQTRGEKFFVLDGFGRRKAALYHLNWPNVNVAIIEGDARQCTVLAAIANTNQVCQRHYGEKDKQVACYHLRQQGIPWEEISQLMGLKLSTTKSYTTAGARLFQNKQKRLESLVGNKELFISPTEAKQVCLQLFNELLCEEGEEIKTWPKMQEYVQEHFSTKVSHMRADDNEMHRIAYDFLVFDERHGNHRSLALLYCTTNKSIVASTQACENYQRWFGARFASVTITPNLKRLGVERDTILRFLENGRIEKFQSVET